MNLHPHAFASAEGLDALAGLDGLDALDGRKAWHKKLKKVSLAGKVHQVNRKLFKKVAPKPVYRLKKKTERVAKRNALTIAAAVATVATGGAAAPALYAAMQKTAGNEAMRAGMKRKAKHDQHKAIKQANAEADRIAAAYEADLNRQDAAAPVQPANVLPFRAPAMATSFAPTESPAAATAPEAREGEYLPAAAPAAEGQGPLAALKGPYLWIGAGLLAVLLLRK